MGFIKGQYILNTARRNTVPTQRVSVFKTFRYTDMSNLKVVILSDAIIDKSTENNGLPLSSIVTDFKAPNKLTKVIQETVEKTVYDGIDLNFDYSLKSWCDQGVLLLNTSLTCEKGRGEAHEIFWKQFIRDVIGRIDKEKEGIIFCFWGRKAKYFASSVNQDFNYVLLGTTPEEAIWSRGEWDCDHFEKINAILKKDNRDGFQIIW